MANGRNNTPIIVLGVIIVGVIFALAFGGQFQGLNIGTPATGGVPTPTPATPAGTQEFAGQLLINVIHRDALDNAEPRTEGTNLVTTYYKSLDEVTFNTIGSGTGNQITIGADMNSIMYVTVTVPAGQDFFVSPQTTADQALNPRIIDFFFRDISADGIKEWVFKVDLRDMQPPTAGQTSSTMSLFINSFDEGVPSLNSPANVTGVGTGSGQQNFIRWELTQPEETASAQTEYQIAVDSESDEKWDIGLSTLDMPNIGIKPLSEFSDDTSGGTTTYKFKTGKGTNTLDSANYVSTPQNGNAVIAMPFKFVTNLATSDDLAVTLNIKSLDTTQGSNAVVTDTVQVQEA